MLNNIQAIFSSEFIEQEYRTSQLRYIKSQYTSFCVQSSLFIIMFTIYYWQTKEHEDYITVGCVMSIILLIINNCVILKYPKYIDSVLVISQIIMGGIQAIAFMIELDEQEEVEKETGPNYDWFYGFQACYFHLGTLLNNKAILIQGFQYIYQAFVLLVILIFYVFLHPSNTLEYIQICLVFFILFLGMIFMQYKAQIIKRIQFIEERERKRWDNLIDNSIEEPIIIVKMDKNQDQLVIHQANLSSNHKLKIIDNSSLREFLRKFQTECSGQQVNQSLEQLIRKSIAVNKQDPNQCSNLLIRNKQNQSVYSLNLMRYWVEQQLTIVLILHHKGDRAVGFHNKVQILQNMLRSTLYYSMNLLQRKQLTKIEIIASLINLQSLQFWLNQRKVNLRKSSTLIYLDLVQHFLNQFYGSRITFNRIWNQISFCTNAEVLTFIVFAIIEISKRGDSKIRVNLESKQLDFEMECNRNEGRNDNHTVQNNLHTGIQCFELSIIICDANILPTPVQQFLNQSQDFILYNKHQELVIKSIQFLKKSHFKLASIQNLIIVKFLLQMYGLSNSIVIEQQLDSTKFIMNLINVQN